MDRRYSGRPVPLRRSRRKLATLSRRCGTCRSARAGSAAAMTTPAFTAFRPIRAIRTRRSSPFPAAAYGRRATTARLGRCSAKGSLRPMCRPSRPRTARSRIRIASCVAPPRRTSCGCSTTPASTARPMPAHIGRGCRCRATISASRSWRIRATRRPRGSCRRSKMRSACRATARYA